MIRKIESGHYFRVEGAERRFFSPRDYKGFQTMICGILFMFLFQGLLGEGGVTIKRIGDLKSNFGFPEKTVSEADLGLKKNEVLSVNLFDSIVEKGKYSFDEKMLLMSIGGMINRSGPLVFLDATASGWRGDATWINYYRSDHGFKFVRLDNQISEFIKRTAPVFNGIILYDAEPSDNHWLAMNLASLNFCLPVSQRVYDQYRESFGKMPVLMKIPKKALTREEIYDWLIREVLPKTDLTVAYTPSCHFPDIRLTKNWEELALDIDYPFYRKMFMFNISPLPASVPGFLGADGSPSMARQFDAIMKSLKVPARIFGWSVSEAEYSLYGHIQVCSVTATNLSFHAVVKPLQPPPYVQDLKPKIEKPEKKVYLSFAANEGDTLIVLSQLYYGEAWLNSGRGKVPLNWQINPYFAHLFPAMVEYYFRTKTPKDYFVCGPSGAGYVHPDNMTPAQLDEYLAFTRKWMKEGVTTREITLWEGRDPAVQEAYAKAIPELRGVTIKPEQMYPYGEVLYTKERKMPVLREPIATQYWMINPRFVAPMKAWSPDQDKVKQFFQPYQVDVDGFTQYLDELDANVEKPYFFMVFGLQVNLAESIAQIQKELDPKRFEIVDMGTLMHLATVDGKSKKETLLPAAVASSHPVWKPERLQNPQGWKSEEGALLSTNAKGLKVTIPKGKESVRVTMENVSFPANANRVKVNVSKVDQCRWTVWMAGNVLKGEKTESVDIQGGRSASDLAQWAPFSEWSPFRRFPGKEERPIDPSFVSHNRKGGAVTLHFQVTGTPGGSAVFEDFDFVEK